MSESGKIKKIVLTAILFACAVVLSFLENMLPPFAAALPGIKPGLSNIVVMYSLFFISEKHSLSLAGLKSLFVFATRGPVAALLSLSGGIFSITVMILLILISGKKISYMLLSIFGAIAHNMGQYIIASLIYGIGIWAFLPVILIFGIIMGIITAILLKFAMPALDKAGLNR